MCDVSLPRALGIIFSPFQVCVTQNQKKKKISSVYYQCYLDDDDESIYRNVSCEFNDFVQEAESPDDYCKI